MTLQHRAQLKDSNMSSKSQKVHPRKGPSTRKRLEQNDILLYQDNILEIEDIPGDSIDLIVTSPPYNVDIDYNSNTDDLPFDEYLLFTGRWLDKLYTLSKNDGRLCLNIPIDENKGGHQSVYADIVDMAKWVGWKYHATIIWNKGNTSKRTAWGSWMSASAPHVIAPVEAILVMYKDQWKKVRKGTSDITKEEFMEWTNGMWTFNGQNKRGAGGHPAPFPIELPKRCIKLFSFLGDTVLDPFCGSGSTLIAANMHDRRGVGVEIDEKYCDIAVNRLKKEAKINQYSMLDK